MISPHTPPGTPLIVVWTSSDRRDIIEALKPEYRSIAEIVYQPYSSESDIQVGQRVTLDRIEPCEYTVDGFVAIIVGRDAFYSLKCFDIAVLPSAITDMLVGDRVPEDA